MIRWVRATRCAALVVLASLTVTACGAETSVTGTDRTADETVAEIFDGWATFASKLSFSDAVVHLADALPAAEPRDPQVRSDGVVVGSVMEAARGHAWGSGDEAAGSERVEVDWASDEADWRTATLTVDVEHLWSATLPEGTDTIELEVRIAGVLTPDEFVDGLSDLGRIVAVLDVRPVGEDPPHQFGVLHASTALGQVDAEGDLSFPAMLEESATFMGPLTSVRAIERADG